MNKPTNNLLISFFSLFFFIMGLVFYLLWSFLMIFGGEKGMDSLNNSWPIMIIVILGIFGSAFATIYFGAQSIKKKNK